jgi:hypothetical protein
MGVFLKFIVTGNRPIAPRAMTAITSYGFFFKKKKRKEKEVKEGKYHNNKPGSYDAGNA